jgi:predicted RecA/RadA family phage recombinase
MKNFVQPGHNLTLTAAAAVSSGDILVVGSIVGIALTDAASGAEVEVACDGVFKLDKTSAATLAIGDVARLAAAGTVGTTGTDPAIGLVVGTYDTSHVDVKIFGRKVA